MQHWHKLHFIVFLGIYTSRHPAVQPVLYDFDLTLGCGFLPFLKTLPSALSFPALMDKMSPTSATDSIYKKELMAQSTRAISCESPSVMINLTNCNVSGPNSTGRASWKNQRNSQDLFFKAKHLSTTITFPSESFTEVISFSCFQRYGGLH